MFLLTNFLIVLLLCLGLIIMKKTIKVICCLFGFLLFLTLITSLIRLIFPKNTISTSNDISIYNDLVSNVSFLPQTDELHNYKELEFKYTHDDSLFPSKSYILKAEYNENDYISEKELVQKEYYFDEKYSSKIHVENYLFRVLDIERYNLRYPKYLALIGFSDNAQKIVYIYFECQDLDCIDNWEDFIINQCNW